MDLVGWAAWAWIPGIVGVLVALLLLVVLRRPAGAPAPAETAERIAAGAVIFLRREHLVLAAFVILAAALIGLATSLLTAAAYLTGAVCAVLAGVLGVWAGRRAHVAATAEGGASPWRGAFGAGTVAGLALVSLALLGIGAWYFGMGAGAITDADFVLFARVVSGFAFGAGSVALFARVSGGIQAGAARLAAALVATPETGLLEDDPRSPATALASSGRIVGDVAGASAGLFESLAGASIAAMVVGASAQIYAASRGAAVALPVLTMLAGLVTSLVAVGLARALDRQRLGAALRTLTIASTLLFLVLEYLVVRALHFQIVDPTGARVYRPDAPFLAILAGAVVGLLVGALSERAVASGARERPGAETPASALADGVGAALQATAAPALLVTVAIWLSYYVAGIYGIGLAAIGLLGTAGMTAAVNTCGAIAAELGLLTGLAGRQPDGLAAAEELAAPGRTALAVGKGTMAVGAAFAALSLFIAYVSASGAELGGLLLLDSRVLAGLLLGGLASFLVAGMAVRGAASVGARIAGEAGRQLHEVKGLLQGRTVPDVARGASLAAPAALRRTIGPALIIVPLPVIAGVLDLELLSGLLVGAMVSGLLLALFLGHASALAEAGRAGAEPARAEGAQSPVRHAAGPWRALAGPFADAAAPAIGMAMTLMGATSLVLAPWFARLHGASILQEESLRAARQLLALLSR